MKKDLKQLFQVYIEEREYSGGLSPQTLKSYGEVFKHFSTIMYEVTSVEDLTTEMFNLFFKRIRTRPRKVGKNTIKTGLANSTIKTYASKLNAFCEWLIIRSYMEKNSLKNIKIPYPEYTDKRALENEEINKILTAVNLHSTKNPLLFKRDTMIIYILFFCGLRKGELLGLRVIDINIEKRLLTVRPETSKSKKTRYVPIHPTALFHIKEYLKERNSLGYKTPSLIVSSSEDRELTTHGLKHWVNKLNSLSGVKFHIHRFRHSFATSLAKSGSSIAKIQKVMGHADPKMTSVYLRSITAEDCEDDIAKLSLI